MDRKTWIESQGSVHLQISELDERFDEVGTPGQSLATMFEPQNSVETKNSSTPSALTSKRPAFRGPEKKLTLLALRLAKLEKTATMLGTLGFVWATVVLLGGFAITLDGTDFWFITTILLIEVARIFSRSHELEWQHHSTWSITVVGINSFRAIRTGSHYIAMIVRKICKPLSAVSKASHHNTELKQEARKKWDQQRTLTRTWSSSEVPLLPYTLSLMKLIRHDYGEIEKGDTDKRNRNATLHTSYILFLGVGRVIVSSPGESRLGMERNLLQALRESG
ncbi:hypothetical protein LIER_07808 [Lithospermum erythrorhizon]|uniref:Uncharacterized protein n=1 Tax=Lithospermum erythrorhizon TaxID=34254 RepID=A0AAV3PAB3_LITER